MQVAHADARLGVLCWVGLTCWTLCNNAHAAPSSASLRQLDTCLIMLIRCTQQRWPRISTFRRLVVKSGENVLSHTSSCQQLPLLISNTDHGYLH